jgi:hypothetical protein
MPGGSKPSATRSENEKRGHLHDDGSTIKIRKVSQPEEEQKPVRQMLGIDWESASPSKKTDIPA